MTGKELVLKKNFPFSKPSSNAFSSARVVVSESEIVSLVYAANLSSMTV